MLFEAIGKYLWQNFNQKTFDTNKLISENTSGLILIPISVDLFYNYFLLGGRDQILHNDKEPNTANKYLLTPKKYLSVILIDL